MPGLWSSARGSTHSKKSQKPPCLIEDPWGRRFWIFSKWNLFFIDFMTKFVRYKKFTQRPYGRKRFPGQVSKSFECWVNALYIFINSICDLSRADKEHIWFNLQWCLKGGSTRRGCVRCSTWKSTTRRSGEKSGNNRNVRVGQIRRGSWREMMSARFVSTSFSSPAKASHNASTSPSSRKIPKVKPI